MRPNRIGTIPYLKYEDELEDNLVTVNASGTNWNNYDSANLDDLTDVYIGKSVGDNRAVCSYTLGSPGFTTLLAGRTRINFGICVAGAPTDDVYIYEAIISGEYYSGGGILCVGWMGYAPTSVDILGDSSNDYDDDNDFSGKFILPGVHHSVFGSSASSTSTGHVHINSSFMVGPRLKSGDNKGIGVGIEFFNMHSSAEGLHAYCTVELRRWVADIPHFDPTRF